MTKENQKEITAMNVLSLFDGLSGGRIALERAGIRVDNYYSSEIDKYAIQIANKNYPQDEVNRLGDVTKWQDWNINWSNIDLVTGGFPCQAWSIAGKQQGDRDERGMLFWTMLDIMKKVLEHNPKAKFLIENVKMKKEFEEYITLHTSNALGVVHKHLMNSALVSAQNRQRYYWTNIENIEQPKDKGILLRDILEDGLNDVARIVNRRLNQEGKREDYNFNIPLTEQIELRKDNKSGCLTTVQKDNVVLLRPCKIREYKQDSICHHIADAIDIKGNECIKRVYADSGKSPTLTTMTGGHREPKVLISNLDKFKLSDEAIAYMGRLRNGKPRWEYHTNPLDGKAACLTANMYKGVPYGVIKELYRKLTPLECERLQTLPDNYTDCVSNSQRYKAIGNGWTIDVIAHIFKKVAIN